MPDSLTRSKDAARYARALLCMAAALLARLALNSLFGGEFPYATMTLTVLVCVRFWGVGPSIVVAIAGAAGSAAITGNRDPVRLVLYLTMASLAIWIIEALRRAHDRATREEALSAQLRAIVESSGDAIVSVDLNGVVQSWNAGAEQIFGYSAAETAGQPMSMLVGLDRLHEESDAMERIRHGGRVMPFETVRLRKDGKPIHVSLTVSPVCDAAGRIVGASYIARDITQRAELEEQLRVTQKLESLGVLAGGVAHDFNNILTGIMGNASLAIDDLELSSMDARRTFDARSKLSEILKASDRAAILVAQMLAYAGKGQFVIERVNLSEQIEELEPLLRSSVSRLVDLDLRLDPGAPPVEGDRSQIQQMVLNLVTNGAEAIGDQSGTVRVRVLRRETDAEQQVVLEVQDTGCGMDEETRSRIFDPFFSTKFTGRGLGLAAVMGIIRAHRGTISVDSAEGRGSTFTVVLPAVAQGKLPAQPERPTDIRGYGRILVVDDEELVRKLAQFTLERCGYTVDVACDGRDAVDRFGKSPDDFAAVVLDLAMPVMGGEEALTRIREIRPDVPVLLSSGFSEVDAARHFRERGVAGFLQKPYTATALARKVKQACRRQTRTAGD